MLDLEDPQNEWEVEEIHNKHQIKSIIHYLVKWTGWSSKYNSYKLVNYLISIPRAVADFEHKLKQKQKKIKAVGKADNINNNNKTAESEDTITPHRHV